MRHTKRITIFTVFLAVLNLQISNVFISQDAALANPGVQASTIIFAASNEAAKDPDRFNITLSIKDWKGKIGFGNLNVTIYDLKGKMASSYLSNKTGYVDLRKLYAGSYIISVQDENRTVGYQKIDVTKNENFVVRTWAYDLNLTLSDESGKPLSNHTVFLYDQMVFKAPNYTIMTDRVVRRANYTVITDEVGRLVNQTKTNVNGTVRFIGLWNGTYRTKIMGNESWIGEYILGEYVLKRLEPASGEYVLKLQEPASLKLKCFRVDLTLKFISESNNPIRNATIYIRNRLGHLLFKDRTNKTGFIQQKNIYVIDGLYAVAARFGNRTVGYKVINVTKSETFTVKAWAYNLTIKCVDQLDRPLSGNVVFLHDQLVFYTPTNFTVVANRTGLLVNWTRTDKNGTAYFKDIWNGTYKVRVTGGELIAEGVINLQKPESIILRCNKTYLALKFITESDEPLSNATVYIYSSAGHLIFRDYVDQNGYIRHEYVYLDNYTVFVEWTGMEVWSGVVDTYQDRELTVRCSVFRLTLRVVDPFGNPLPYAEVVLRKKIMRWGRWEYVYPAFQLKSDETGYISRLLPSGIYEASCSYGIYSGSAFINLISNYGEVLHCNVQLNILFLTLFVASPLAGLTLLLELKRLRKPLEIRKYKNMLSKLESTYKSGQIEYKLYRKLREEYEAKLMELGGREMR